MRWEELSADMRARRPHDFRRAGAAAAYERNKFLPKRKAASDAWKAFVLTRGAPRNEQRADTARTRWLNVPQRHPGGGLLAS